MTATVGQLLTEGTERLRRIVKDNPRFVAEVFLRAILKLKKIDLYLELAREISASDEIRFRKMVNRKIEREPMQYIVGDTEFYGLTIKCDRRALIPRPETEILTERAIELLKPLPSPRVIDIGTGTGAIAIAIATEIKNATLVATDLAGVALLLAEENIQLHQLTDRVQLKAGNLVDAVGTSEQFDLIISNPPYVRTAEYEKLMPEVKDHEPRDALVAGKDGLEVIGELIPTVPQYLKPGGWLVFEFGIDHTESVKKLAEQCGMYKPAEIIVDYNQVDRGVILQLK